MTNKRIGVPKEIKSNESRVALTPDGVVELTSRGVHVLVESEAGIGASITDQDFESAGATICDAKSAWSADMVIKVKEPQSSEFQYFREDLVLFTFLHLAAYPQVAKALCDSKTTAFAYETVEVNSQLPLLAPMSEIAGRLSVQVAARFLEKPQGGRGILLPGAPGVSPAKVCVLGAGNVGLNAALLASKLGAQVEIYDINLDKLRNIDMMFHSQFVTRASSKYSVSEAVKNADALIGAVLVPGAKAPIVVTEEMVASMKPGSVIVDTAIDQGGCVESSKETSHHEPTFIKHGVVHYAVGNMPGAVAHTSTYALTNATLSFAVALATNDIDTAISDVHGLQTGLNTRNGEIVNGTVRLAIEQSN